MQVNSTSEVVADMSMKLFAARVALVPSCRPRDTLTSVLSNLSEPWFMFVKIVHELVISIQLMHFLIVTIARF